jgi:GTP cyclohydrolase FolE2
VPERSQYVLASILKLLYHNLGERMEHTELSRMGGKARAKKLTKKERSDAARVAVNARWEKDRKAKASAKRKGKAKSA